MDLPNILNSKGAAAAAAAERQLQQERQLHHHLAQHANGHTLSSSSSERGLSPHNSEMAPRYSSHNGQPLHPLSAMVNGPGFQGRYQESMAVLPNNYMPQHPNMENGNDFIQNHHQQAGRMKEEPSPSVVSQAEGGTSVKAFACVSCGKGFARRSDLARHERIHTGDRPHVCDYPGCQKQFIQRSALTVHARVHTGEKPHMCERCSKPFSDSSSLARHRRIHSGKRPYKCPFADCQKTFTRRTTLTRHQNHHTGTVEEAAAATAAVLASRPSMGRRSDGGTYSDTGTATSTPSPDERNISLSPATEIPQMSISNRLPGAADYSYLPSAGLPPHMRNSFQEQSPRSSPSATSPSLSNFVPAQPNHHRPSLTSHPQMYGPPPTLEPHPTHHNHQQSGSSNSSPHMSGIGWQSPTHAGGLGSPPGSVGDGGYIYPEPPYGGPAPHLYYQNSNMRRPNSTEPDQYETKPRLLAGEVMGYGQM